MTGRKGQEDAVRHGNECELVEDAAHVESSLAKGLVHVEGQEVAEWIQTALEGVAEDGEEVAQTTWTMAQAEMRNAHEVALVTKAMKKAAGSNDGRGEAAMKVTCARLAKFAVAAASVYAVPNLQEVEAHCQAHVSDEADDDARMRRDGALVFHSYGNSGSVMQTLCGTGGRREQ